MKDDFRDRSKLTVIEGGAPKKRRKPYRRRVLGEPEQVTCHVCEADTGVATSAVIEMTLSPLRTPDGRKVGGKKAYVCPYCLIRGKLTQLNT